MRNLDIVLTDLEASITRLTDYLEEHIEEETLDVDSPDLVEIVLKYKGFMDEIMILVKNKHYGAQDDPEENCIRMMNITQQFKHLTAEVQAYYGN